MEATRISPTLPFEGRRRKSRIARMQIIIAIIPMVFRTLTSQSYDFDKSTKLLAIIADLNFGL